MSKLLLERSCAALALALAMATPHARAQPAAPAAQAVHADAADTGGAAKPEENKEQEKPAAPPGLKVSGHVVFSLGAQRHNRDSLFPVEGDPDEMALVSRKTSAVFKLNSPAGYSAVLDAQYDARPYSGRASRVNQFYVAFDLNSSLRMRVGKQRVLWGRGFIYVPTDFINPPLDPSGLDLAKVGVPAVSLDYLSEKYSVTALVRRERKGIDSAGIKFAPSGVSGMDLDFVAYHAPSIGNAVGASVALDAEQLISPRLGGLVLMGGVAAHRKSRYPQIVDGTFSTPAGPVAYPLVGPEGKSGAYYSLLAGATYQASNTLLLLGEYYRIGDAYSGSGFDTVLGALTDKGSPRQAAAQPWLNHLSYGRNKRNYLNVSVNRAALTEGSNRFTDTFGVEVAMLRSLDERSGLTSVALISNYWDQTEVTMRGFFPQGKRNTEFGTTPYTWHVEFGIKIGF